jgi:hypothetical protein
MCFTVKNLLVVNLLSKTTSVMTNQERSFCPGQFRLPESEFSE